VVGTPGTNGGVGDRGDNGLKGGIGAKGLPDAIVLLFFNVT
jgi:hypothetical protein